MQKAISIWLFSCTFLVFIMIGVGGYTRLEGAGLSIVEWKPINGVIFPTTESAWEEEFSRYKQFPEYKARQEQVSLYEFKRIYFIEYSHRLIGRVIGLVFMLPLLFLIATKKISKKDAIYLSLILLLFAAQGAFGWYMVKSGLDKVPYVSHYRLATHMILALFIYGLLFWKGLSFYIGTGVRVKSERRFKHFLILMMLLLFQITLGAFLAGLDGGMVYNTFPLMNGKLIPEDILLLKPWYDNLLSNISTIQFLHRIVPIFIIVYGIALLINKRLRGYILGFSLIVFIQCLLGVLTLLNFVPTELALAHQLCAVVLFTNLLFIAHRLRFPSVNLGKK